MYIEDGCVVSVHASAQTALLESGEYVDVTSKGNFSVPSINVKYLGTLEFRQIESYYFTITTAWLELKHKGKILMNNGFIDAGNVDLETLGEIDLNGRGHENNMGPGSPLFDTHGASYGGSGGGAGDTLSYGSVFSPTDMGSGGRGIHGGAGGGFVHFKVGQLMHIDGLVKSFGTAAISSDYGGGSGGTVFIEAYNMAGHGTLDVSGGQGSGHGCGGSGGRIAAHIGFKNDYGGYYKAHGGNRGLSTSSTSCDGGPGTIYKYESSRGPQYRELKYNPRLNVTTVNPEHSKLTVDNADLLTQNPAMIMEHDTIYYEFDEIQVEGHSYVHFYHPQNTENVTVIIHELTGNKKGFVRVQSRQQVFVDFVESTHTYFDAPCGFHVDSGGELVMPTVIYITTEKFILGGRLVGVETIILERGAELVIQEHAHTQSVQSIGFFYLDTGAVSYIPGYITTGTVYVNNKGKITIQINPVIPTISTGSFHVKNGGVVTMATLYTVLNSTDLVVEKGAVITGDGLGHSIGEGDGTATSGSGAGYASNGKYIRYLTFMNVVIKIDFDIMLL